MLNRLRATRVWVAGGMLVLAMAGTACATDTDVDTTFGDTGLTTTTLGLTTTTLGTTTTSGG